MRIKTSQTRGEWIDIAVAEDVGEPPSGSDEAKRVLSAAIRSQNLTVLTGLGTSLCVTKDEKRLAPTMADLIGIVEKTFAELDKVDDPFNKQGGRWAYFKKLANVDQNCSDLEFLLSRAKVAAEFLSNDQADSIIELLKVAENQIRQAVDFLDPAVDLPIHSGFLRRVARRSARRSRVKLFTTNYDRCFEQSAQHSGFVVVDGFAFGSDSMFNSAQFEYDVVRRSAGEEKSEFIENLFHLYKLHGSIDWVLDEDSNRILKRAGTENPLLIYPRSTKYEMAFSQPYIEMMGAFQASLRGLSTTLIVVGFGFNDKHISEPILAAVKANLSLNLLVVDPFISGRCNGQNDFLSEVNELVDYGDGRISLIEAKFEEFVGIIPDVVAETEVEKHSERLRKVGASRA